MERRSAWIVDAERTSADGHAEWAPLSKCRPRCNRCFLVG
jgi:hypothetical protein